MFDYQRKGYSQYGACMGRSSDLSRDSAGRCLIRHVPLEGDYDPGGAYWGGPNNLYYIEDLDSGEVAYMRAGSIDLARNFFPRVTWVEAYQPGDLDDFVTAYISCALWSSNDESDDQGGEPLDRNYSVDDLAEETKLTIKNDCESFVIENTKDINGAYSQAGNDFWLTRNRSGAGFWDGDWAKDVGKRLTDSAHAFGEVNLYVGDDGKIYQG